MSVSAASTMACFQFSCTGDSAADTMRVPICTPSAPSAKRRGHGRPVDDAAGRDDRHVDLRRAPAAAAPWSPRPWVLEAAALAALDHQPVDTGVDRLERRPQGRHHVEHGEPGRLQLGGVLGGVAGRGGDEPHALVDHEVDDGRVAHEGLGDVDAERLVGELAHLADLVADGVELARRGLDDAQRRRRSETAEASWERAIHPIGACTIGMSTPSSSVTRLREHARQPATAAGPTRILRPGPDHRPLRLHHDIGGTMNRSARSTRQRER